LSNVCVVCRGRGLCDELITRPEESYRLWLVVCEEETSWTRRRWEAVQEIILLLLIIIIIIIINCIG
jgi:hypothetical protein